MDERERTASLLQGPAVEALEQVRLAETPDLNWELIREVAGNQARGLRGSAQDPEDRLAWALVAIEAGRRSPRQRHADSDGASDQRTNEMALRSALIADLGDHPGHAVLDLATVVHWFHEVVGNASLPAAPSPIDSMSIDEMRASRRIKNAANAVEPLAANTALNSAPLEEIRTWVAARARLV